MAEHIAVDIGNTFIKAALFEDDKLIDFWRHKTSNASEAAQAILVRPTVKVVISSVVPEVARIIIDTLAKANRQIIFVEPLAQKILSGMNEEMGADRVADAIAAWCLYGERKKATIVMGFGTATTILTISDNGHVEGGLIAPGLSAMFEILHTKCALLPLLTIDDAQAVLGHDTDSHIKNGILLAHIGLIKQWLETGKQLLQGQVITIATGNLAEALSVHEKLFDVVDPLLTLKGINLIAQEQNT